MKTRSLAAIGFALLSLTAFTLPARSQETATAANPLFSSDLPASLKLKELDGTWQRFWSVTPGTDPFLGSYFDRLMRTARPQLEAAGIGVYFTKGKTVKWGGNSFLIAYRIDQSGSNTNWNQIMQSAFDGRNTVVRSGRFSRETKLRLCLLNLSRDPSLEDLRPFDPAQDLLTAKDIIELSAANLRLVGDLWQRMVNSDQFAGHLPLANTLAVRAAFGRYTHIFGVRLNEPSTGEAYSTNVKLAKISYSDVTNSSQVVALYESHPASDGKRGVIFLDGHTDRVPEWKWRSVQATPARLVSPAEIRARIAGQLKKLRSAVLNSANQAGGVLTNDYARYPEQALVYIVNGVDYFPNRVFLSYRVNPKTFGRHIFRVANREKVMLIYEARSGADGKRNVIFVDGHIEQVDGRRFHELSLIKPVITETKPAAKAKSKARRRR